MNSLIVSIIAIALVAACGIITALAIGKPFTNYFNKTIIIEINKNYIDFGMILSSSDNLRTPIYNIDDLRNYNGNLPKINSQEYIMLLNTKNERIFYSNNITDTPHS